MSNEPKTTTTEISNLETLELPPITDDTLSSGAAADPAQSDEHVMALPRLLRYAMLISKGAEHIEERIFAEIFELCPDVELAATWVATGGDSGTGIALATELDRLAVTRDQSELRSLADCVRLRSLPVPRNLVSLANHRRVAKALLQAYYDRNLQHHEDLRSDLEEFCFGWAALPSCTDFVMNERRSAAVNAISLGARMASARVKAAKKMISRQFEAELAEAEKHKALGAGATGGANQAVGPATDAVVPEYHVVVAKIDEVRLNNSKLRDVVEPLKGVINTALPLILSPALHEARAKLLFEFPYAGGVVDAALSDLVGRSIVKLRPLLLVGEPGGGKSRFARRLGDVLGVSVWHTDASRSDGAVFAGTDKRWYSAEPCHPLLAINRARHANPIVLLDELEKAGTRTDYGRLWDCLLGFLEPETNARYPDPALQVELDLSHVSYVATANSVDLLPAPLRDRFRVIAFPKPGRDHLEALLPSLIADFAHQHGVDARWISSLDGTERAAIEGCWAGGSVRRLRRIVEAVLRDRDVRATRN